jgi:hypothetical protein
MRKDESRRTHRFWLPAVHAQLDDLEGDAAFDRLALFGHSDFVKTTFANLFQQFVATEYLGGDFLDGGFSGGSVPRQIRLTGYCWKNVPSAVRPPCDEE